MTKHIRIDLPVPSGLCTYARKLIAAGADPEAMAMIYRGETLCFKPMPLVRWAKLTTEESDKRSIRFRSYSPRPVLKLGCKPAGSASRVLHAGSHPAENKGAV